MTAIYKRDFRAYFSSPLGYVFVAAFLIIINSTFYLTNIMVSTNAMSTVFQIMLYALIVVVPILTMRTFSEDYKQRTDQLLLTSPVRASGVVLGKFLAAYTVFFLSLLLTFIQVIIISAFGTPNIASIIGNYVAIIAAASVYISIGVFISSLTENQLVASIASLGIFVALLIMDFAYSLVTAEWLKIVLYWLSIYRRFNTFYMGVFSIADFVYYISITSIFIFLTVRGLEKKRWA